MLADVTVAGRVSVIEKIGKRNVIVRGSANVNSAIGSGNAIGIANEIVNENGKSTAKRIVSVHVTGNGIENGNATEIGTAIAMIEAVIVVQLAIPVAIIGISGEAEPIGANPMIGTKTAATLVDTIERMIGRTNEAVVITIKTIVGVIAQTHVNPATVGVTRRGLAIPALDLDHDRDRVVNLHHHVPVNNKHQHHTLPTLAGCFQHP